MTKHQPTRRTVRSATMFESMEARRLLAWSSYATLIGQDQLAGKYASLTGAGQTVAMIDTGIDYNNSSLGGGFGKGKKVIGGYDFVDNDADPMDTDGHGTETAGMVAANPFTDNGVQYSGIAPGAKLLAVRVGTGNSGIADSQIEKGLQWVIANAKKFDVTVVNISLGGGSYAADYDNSQLADEFTTLAKLDIFVVAASGNDGDTGTIGIAYPAADPNVFAAGSVNGSDQISDFTQRGTELDLLAPGEGVVSTKKGGGYATIDGTSFSSPITAGAAALLRQAAPSLGATDVASVLRTSSTADYDATTGRYYARLNLINAIALAKSRNSATLDELSSSRSTAVDSIVDAGGIVHLAYYDAEGKRILYATQRSDGQWTEPVAIDKSGDDVGQQLSISLDQAGRPAVAYFDATKSDLKYAIYTAGKWATTTVEAKNSTGQYPSLAFDQSGDAIIAYYKKSGGDLKLATQNRSTGGWDTSVLDSTGDVGQYASLAFNSTAVGTSAVYSLAIAYADKTNGNLKYYRYTNNRGGDTVDEVVDDLGGVANIHLTLDVGTDGTAAAHLAYQDVAGADVKLANRVNVNSWVKQVVASKGSVGQNISSYMDAAGDYHVVYYDKSRGATYDARYDIATSNTALTLADTSRVGTAGQLATVASDDDGNATLVGLNKSGKAIDASALVDDA